MVFLLASLDCTSQSLILSHTRYSCWLTYSYYTYIYIYISRNCRCPSASVQSLGSAIGWISPWTCRVDLGRSGVDQRHLVHAMVESLVSTHLGATELTTWWELGFLQPGKPTFVVSKRSTSWNIADTFDIIHLVLSTGRSLTSPESPLKSNICTVKPQISHIHDHGFSPLRDHHAEPLKIRNDRFFAGGYSKLCHHHWMGHDYDHQTRFENSDDH